MNDWYFACAVLALGLLVYLFVAMLMPERLQ